MTVNVAAVCWYYSKWFRRRQNVACRLNWLVGGVPGHWRVFVSEVGCCPACIPIDALPPLMPSNFLCCAAIQRQHRDQQGGLPASPPAVLRRDGRPIAEPQSRDGYDHVAPRPRRPLAVYWDQRAASGKGSGVSASSGQLQALDCTELSPLNVTAHNHRCPETISIQTIDREVHQTRLPISNHLAARLAAALRRKVSVPYSKRVLLRRRSAGDAQQ